MHRFTIKGAELAYVQQGKGTPVVFVHGALGDYRSWHGQMNLGARHHHVVAYSRRYHHPAACPAGVSDYTPDLHAGDLVALISGLKLSPVHLVGHSYGAAVAACLAAKHPELVRSLVLAEPTLFSLLKGKEENRPIVHGIVSLTEQVLNRLQNQGMEPAVKHFIDTVIAPLTFEELAAPVHAVMMENASTLKPMLQGTRKAAPFRPEHAQRIKTPTLLLEGALSVPMFRQTIRELKPALPNSKVVTLPDVSHGLHLENPQRFNQIVLEFLSRQER